MVKVSFIGDIALFKDFQKWGIDPFKLVSLPKSDYYIGNFEFVIPKNRKKYFFDVLDQYAIDYDYFTSLNLNRFNAYGMANNHCMDYGIEGSEDVAAVFKEKGIKYFGIGYGDYNVLKFTLNEISFAVIGVAKEGRWSRKNEKDYGPDSYNIISIINKIQSLKNEVDHVIIFSHFGTELVDIPDPNDVKNSRLMIENGASVVIGHHPHIIQGIEMYKNGIIAYSLGSFIYIPENEQGYKIGQGENRNYSICMNVSFDKAGICKADPVYYKYDKDLKVPIEFLGTTGYFEKLNNSIENERDYYKSVRQVLFQREMISFIQRFKENPFSTVKHYCTYLKIKHIKKIIHK